MLSTFLQQNLTENKPFPEMTEMKSAVSINDPRAKGPESFQHLNHKDKVSKLDGTKKSKSEEICDITKVLDKIVDQQRESSLPLPELDVFDGGELKFETFMRNFKFVVEEKTTDPVRRLELFLKYTSGQAKELISQCPMIEPAQAGYERALKLLRRNYGDPATIAAAYRNKAESWPRVLLGDKEAMRKYSIFLTNCCSAKISNRHMASLDTYDFLRTLVSKLPTAIQQKWIHLLGKCREEEDRSPTLEDLNKFVGKLSRDENDPRIAGLGYQGRKNESNKTYQKGTRKGDAKVFATNVSASKDCKSTSSSGKASSAPCLHCGEGTKHSITECRKFGSLNNQEKSQICKTKGLCFGCLNPGHMKRSCHQKLKCSKCNKCHPTILHDPNWKKPGNNDQKATNETSTPQVLTGCVGLKEQVCAQASTNKYNAPMMTIVPVIVKAKTSDKGIYTYAF